MDDVDDPVMMGDMPAAGCSVMVFVADASGITPTVTGKSSPFALLYGREPGFVSLKITGPPVPRWLMLLIASVIVVKLG